jgi:hypothetical protein
MWSRARRKIRGDASRAEPERASRSRTRSGDALGSASDSARSIACTRRAAGGFSDRARDGQRAPQRRRPDVDHNPPSKGGLRPLHFGAAFQPTSRRRGPACPLLRAPTRNGSSSSRPSPNGSARRARSREVAKGLRRRYKLASPGTRRDVADGRDSGAGASIIRRGLTRETRAAVRATLVLGERSTRDFALLTSAIHCFRTANVSRVPAA